MPLPAWQLQLHSIASGPVIVPYDLLVARSSGASSVLLFWMSNDLLLHGWPRLIIAGGEICTYLPTTVINSLQSQTPGSPFGFRMNCRLLASRHTDMSETTPRYDDTKIQNN
jgi:CBS-domain-containing membrane protein